MERGRGPARLAIDIGGTFTDLVVETARGRTTAKVLTTSDAPERAVLEGIRRVLPAGGLIPAEVSLVIHGTTLATNAIIERKGARTALITTEGFRDVLAIGDEGRFDQYDINLIKTEPLIPRRRRFTVRERIAAGGEVLIPLEEDAVRALLPELERLAVQSVAIGFLHAYANPAHERRCAEILRAALPDLWVTLSSEVCPEIREYERFTTASANAYVQPRIAGYLRSLARGLEAEGLACPLFLMTSGGGLMTVDHALREPIRLVESGPAGGAILAARIAQECGLDQVVSFDMGGTTAKICLIEHGTPQTTRSFEVDRQARFVKGSGLPLRVPVIEMVEIGAGGGSIARLDMTRRIAVGPDSAGSEPGPACYGRGGEAATVTDADLELGRIDPLAFAGGRMPLQPERARRALALAIGEPLGLETTLAALGVAEMVDEAMANAARVHGAERGCEVAGRILVAFGGAAPIHAARLAAKLGIRHIVVPAGAGVGSAVGFLRAPAAYEVIRSRYMRLDGFDAGSVNRIFADLELEARAVVEAAAPDADLEPSRSAHMRYVGQGHEIVAPLPARRLAPGDASLLQASFDQTYRMLYGRLIPGLSVEVLSWGLKLMSKVEPVHPMVEPAKRTVALPVERRALFDIGAQAWIEAFVYRRPDLLPGVTLEGPALVVEEDTTILVAPGWSARRRARPPQARASGGTAGMSREEALAGIDRQILWNRLIAVVEEQAATLVRTAFSPIVRECGDLSAGVFDLQGRMLAQAVTGTPGHVNSMAKSVGHFLRHFALENMHEGDVYITNDPWMGTGHLHDFVLTTPAFHKGRLVALFACTSHLVDIGGIGFGPDGKDVLAEGLYIPMLKLADRGRINQTLLAMVRANSRSPIEAEGDVYSLAACNDIGARRLSAMMDEFGLDGLEDLAAHIIEQSRSAVLRQVQRLPFGTWRNAMTLDGYDQPIELVATLTIDEQGVEVDYAGSSPVSRHGINVPRTYCEAYTCFGLACAIAPGVPNNAGSLSAYRVSAPEGCILNAPYPSPVATRHVIGQMLPDVVFGCLHQAIPERVPAEGTSCLWTLTMGRGATGPHANARRFMLNAVHNGGTGARPRADGLSATAYPSGVRGTPVEITESISPLLYRRRELRPDSGGAGRTRGGLGQVIEVEARDGAPFGLWAAFDRIRHAPRGRAGGKSGQAGRLMLNDGTLLAGKGYQEIPAGRRLVVHTPGGGGYGDPAERDPAAATADLSDGLTGAGAARPGDRLA